MGDNKDMNKNQWNGKKKGREEKKAKTYSSQNLITDK